MISSSSSASASPSPVPHPVEARRDLPRRPGPSRPRPARDVRPGAPRSGCRTGCRTAGRPPTASRGSCARAARRLRAVDAVDVPDGPCRVDDLGRRTAIPVSRRCRTSRRSGPRIRADGSGGASGALRRVAIRPQGTLGRMSDRDPTRAPTRTARPSRSGTRSDSPDWRRSRCSAIGHGSMPCGCPTEIESPGPARWTRSPRRSCRAPPTPCSPPRRARRLRRPSPGSGRCSGSRGRGRRPGCLGIPVGVTSATGFERRARGCRGLTMTSALARSSGGEPARRTRRLRPSPPRWPSMAALVPLVDDIVLPGWERPDLEAAADEVRAEAVDIGRDPVSLGVAALVPVSIGRTEAEASARADVGRRSSHDWASGRDRHLRHPRGVPGPRHRTRSRGCERPSVRAPGAARTSTMSSRSSRR